MLTGLVAWVLNNYLGKYVDSLNTDQLSIALLSGKVELENLPLRKDALYNLGLPIEIKNGFIGKIQLQIPVRQIRSAPWVIVIEKLYLVANPLPVNEWDSEKEERARQKLKLSALDSVESRWRLETESKDNAYYASSYSSWLGAVTGIVSDIVENLQLQIKDVHIRYEDSCSIPGKSFAFGFTIESLSAQSCDSNWSPTFSHWTKTGDSFKLLELQNFAMYWIDLNKDELFATNNREELENVMSPNQTLKNTRNYIIPSVSAHARMKRNRSEKPLKSTDTPRIVCDLILKEVPITLIDWQYNQIVACMRGLDVIATLRSYRRYRPSSGAIEDPRAWWMYAVSCFYPGGRQPAICKPRPTWESALKRAKENVQYVQIYKKILMTPNVTLSLDEKEVKDGVEWDRDIEELKVLRQIAMKSLKVDRNGNTGSNQSSGRSMLESWFPQWMGWYSTSTTNEAENVVPTETALEEELFQVLSDSAENNTILKRDAVFGKFNFSLTKGCLNLCTFIEETKESNSMLELEFKNLSLTILSKPRTQSHLVELSLGSLSLKDKTTPNTLFPILVGPPGFERSTVGVNRSRGLQSPRFNVGDGKLEEMSDLFFMSYEKRALSTGSDYKLSIRSKCLDVVYQPNAVRWLTEFVCCPYQRDLAQSRIEQMKSRTKKELFKNWEHMLDGRDSARTSWDLEFDISAPQIIFVEQFSNENSAMAVIDFGRLQLRNNPLNLEVVPKTQLSKDSEEDETFLTPCSTPPQSETDDEFGFEDKTEADVNFDLNEASLHKKIYDSYFLELTDLQILIGKVRDNWRYAHNKGTSKLHVLDRFNISLQIEKRVIHTADPQYPSLTLNANLPKLVAHVNESKINCARMLWQIISATGLPSPFKAPSQSPELSEEAATQPLDLDEEDSASVDTLSVEMSRLLMVQFTVDQLSLEVQSRERSVAELQVAGVKIAFTKRMIDVNVTLTVHSLLLVDALQTFGQDFELLVASHKHVGMDSMSGSLRDSEPTSPTSPASPDPGQQRAGITTSPIALSQALSSLATSPPIRWAMPQTTVDAEALITIDVVLVTGHEPMQIANVQFNNLDIIANQETIVELVGFVRRVFPKSKRTGPTNLSSAVPFSRNESKESLSEEESFRASKWGCTKLTFDFHRLNVLLLRGIIRDGQLYGKKICTATMSEAKIQANVAGNLEVEGSLGGLQVLDLTPEGHMHQRIVSVGRDPLLETTHPIYLMAQTQVDERTAFSFKVVRSLEKLNDKDTADITIRMASLWYTHSPQFVVELQSCATEFKQYLSNLARSIRSAATDMALGLVNARAEALLSQSLYMNAKLSSSMYSSALSFYDTSSPRRRRRSSSMENSGYCSARDTVPQTPYSPNDEDDFIIDINLDVEFDSPVLVLPRASKSTQVFVAHLGKIRMSNKNSSNTNGNGYNLDYNESRLEHYDIEVKDMNLFSLDTGQRRVPGPMIPKPEVLYNCSTLAKPILHDTLIQLVIDREISKPLFTRNSSESNLLLDDEESLSLDNNSQSIQIYGNIVTALKVSLTRSQYEQVLDTVQWLTSSPALLEAQGVSRVNSRPQPILTDISEEDIGVTTLNMDPHVRAKMFPTATNVSKTKQSTQNALALKVGFEVPILIIELKGDSPTGEQGLVDLSLREFVFNYEKFHKYETNIQVSLRSIFMEDLLQPENSKQRSMVISSSGDEYPSGAGCVSRSCPDVSGFRPEFSAVIPGSLPDHLETAKVFGINVPSQPVYSPNPQGSGGGRFPCTPPPSPSLSRQKPVKNLVLISSLLVDPAAPNFASYYNSMQRSTQIDFNCLDLIVSVESWVVVIDFFSASPSNTVTYSTYNVNLSSAEDIRKGSSKENAETNIFVKSLSVAIVKPEYDIAKANISNVDIDVKTCGLRKQVSGKLGSLSLLDLTLHGQLYRERFMTSGKHALEFHYDRHAPTADKDYDAKLSIDMSSVMYVHTKRFVAEILTFFNHFTQLQSVMKSIRVATSGQLVKDDHQKVLLYLQANSPIILLPESSKSTDMLIADLGQLVVKNSFKYSGDKGTISVDTKKSDKKCLLEVMVVELDNMDLYAAVKDNDLKKEIKGEYFKFGSNRIVKNGASFLTKKIQFKLQIETNMNNNVCHNVPDKSVYGELSTLDGALELSQYRLIRGLLAYNLGEERVPVIVTQPSIDAEANIRDVWTTFSLKLDLQNVTLRLLKSHESPPISCINFIKSKLVLETYSDNSQDVDLMSQEILIVDTRFQGIETASPVNVFTNILQPNKNSKKNELQVEIHNRKRRNKTKSTILLNNMRLMAIFDWWQQVREYIFQDIQENSLPITPQKHKPLDEVDGKREEEIFELNMNITDSEIVILEDNSQWDSNAVIFQTTTVLTYKPANTEKPLSCALNNCEMFSCVLGMEETTALSIIDPVTLNIDIIHEDKLEIQLQFLKVRLSYNDMCMFMQIIKSLPNQITTTEKEPEISRNLRGKISTLTALGFRSSDCIEALETCNNTIDDAALWLTRNAVSMFDKNVKKPFIKDIEFRATCVTLCIIDDCRDSDVPLLEFSFSDLCLTQVMPNMNPLMPIYPQGSLDCTLVGSYYNRVLSGWEPVIEPWKCRVAWKKTLSLDLTRNRLYITIESDEADVLNINITSTLIELYSQVKDNWTKDYYLLKDVKKSENHRKRLPFVPYALMNETGSQLAFTTLITEYNKTASYTTDNNWTVVEPGRIVPFTFTQRDKIRHQDSHKLKMHQLTVKVDGWQSVTPVTIDKVGTYFRHAEAEIVSRNQKERPAARIVFDVALEGSARKLVTIRSAVVLVNKLQQSVEVKLESRLPHDTVALWAPSKCFRIDPEGTLAVPIVHAHSEISVKPVNVTHQYIYCSPTISWLEMAQNVDAMHEIRTCHTHKGHNYRFCAKICKIRQLFERANAVEQPAHKIVLLPTVKLINLLPIDFSYSLSGDVGRIAPGSNAAITNANTDNDIKMEIMIENFSSSGTLVVPAQTYTDVSSRFYLKDIRGRKLYLSVLITPNVEAKLKITISAPYWIINKTGLPLVFRQSGSSSESAGQFEDHERARMASPLLFSFSDNDASPTINARVGNQVIKYGIPQWCSNFHVQKGTQVKKLYVTMQDGRPDKVFVIGLEVRLGKGKYRSTNIITISPRYQLYNTSSYELIFAQSCFIKNLSDPISRKSLLKAMPNSHMPFHWPKLEKEQLLCVSIQDIPQCCWSGGLKIDDNKSLHVNVRDSNGRVYFLRLEVVLQRATFFIIFSDADTMPPPIRIDNFSEVSIQFGQSTCKDILGTARAHSSVPYAWDQPTQPNLITLIAPGGVLHSYDMNRLGEQPGLTYENFIYVAFTETFKKNKDLLDLPDVESQEFVLDVIKNNRVVLSCKQQGERSQLWKMSPEGHLMHEGSSPPSHPHQPRSNSNLYVLDIENTAPQPSNYSRLMLRRLDPRRESTQTWRFTEEGRLQCKHYNVCVQAHDGFFGLREGNSAVLGLPQPICHKLTEKGIPIEQAIDKQFLRPGSGELEVRIVMDGPTRVLTIKDRRETEAFAATDEREWGCISKKQRPDLQGDDGGDGGREGELQFVVNLQSGLGISLICRRGPEELLYALFSNIVGEAVVTPSLNKFCVSVGDIRVDNQLFEGSVPVVLYVTPPGRVVDESKQMLPALDFSAEVEQQQNKNATICKYLILKLKKISIIIEERLLLKLANFIGIHSQEEESLNRDENDYETQRLISEVCATHVKRYYFGVILLMPEQIRLSVKTASKLPPHLQRIKRKLGLRLIKFEDAAVDLEAFDRKHPFETSQFLINSIVKHFKEELMWQAGMILGSIDFIGNPLGLMNDVSEGVSGLIFEGNVGALVKNVTHGLSNSAAKVTESLSDGLGSVAMDDSHEEIRQKIRQVESGNSKDHILAGIKGLGFGILGGATGIFKQVYEGASNDGLPGVFSGLGKGLVGAVTKPVVGVLDFASETARAVRETSRSKSMPERFRLPRCVHGPGGLLPKYSGTQSLGQQYLYAVNDKNYEEQLVAYQILGTASEDLQCIVSNKKVRIVANTQSIDLTLVIDCHLNDLEVCNVIADKEGSENRYYIEIVMHVAGTSAALVNPDPIKKPRVRCKNADLAHSVASQINYAKRLYIEYQYTLTNDNIED
ncbi:unnamed protein product [Brassicogethes aeneus]|uniref:UBA domain-containing protein n=1 Tax=Brassicogethes aeneus TaxID=1431903 RepID=A0A9P0B6B0_BRAAE|nr:unnamed protein product [Brassicogethes aeneus]